MDYPILNCTFRYLFLKIRKCKIVDFKLGHDDVDENRPLEANITLPTDVLPHLVQIGTKQSVQIYQDKTRYSIVKSGIKGLQ